MRGVQRVLNARLNGAVRIQIRLLGRALPAFQVCGGIGFALAMPVALILAWRAGLSEWIVLALALCGAFTFLALAMAVKIFTGVERLVYYHHEIAVVAVSALLLRVLHLRVLAYLDITVLGLGLFLGFGRIGCFMVGCCHGKPSDWGVHYTREHADAGFPECYVGVCLLPVQLLESLWVLGVTLAGVRMIWSATQPGEVFAWYLAAYSVGRFAFEFLRGDAERLYAWGFSEAQWTSLVLMCGMAAAGPVVPMFGRWHLAIAVCMAVAMAGLALARRLDRSRLDRLFHPSHLQEMSKIVRQIAALDRHPVSSVRIGRTSLGVHISASVHGAPSSLTQHYGISLPVKTLGDRTALALAGKVAQLVCARAGASELIRSDSGVFHLLIPYKGDRTETDRRFKGRRAVEGRYDA